MIPSAEVVPSRWPMVALVACVVCMGLVVTGGLRSLDTMVFDSVLRTAGLPDLPARPEPVAVLKTPPAWPEPVAVLKTPPASDAMFWQSGTTPLIPWNSGTASASSSASTSDVWMGGMTASSGTMSGSFSATTGLLLGSSAITIGGTPAITPGCVMVMVVVNNQMRFECR